MPFSGPLPVFTVSQLTGGIKELLEMGFAQVCVEGEITGLRTTASKHLYFNLKDEKSTLRIVWFNWNSRGSGQVPEDGQQVRITGKLTVYEAQGVYQVVVSSLETLGLGDILARLERLKRRLEGEGIFDPQRKKKIPVFPDSIALVTSASGAALQDMLRIFRQNSLKIPVRVLPCQVQGAEAPGQIAGMVRAAGFQHLADVIVVARGGGSVEDLLAFSDEAVVRAVAGCPLPTISAVGHEIDFPLTDFAADLRCPTPTAAAEHLSRPWVQLEENLLYFSQELTQAIELKTEKIRLSLKPYSREKLEETYRSLIQPAYQRLDDAKENLLRGMGNRLDDLRQRLQLQTASLEMLDPQAVLERGFSIVTDQNGRAITDAQSLGLGDRIAIRFKEGRATARVEETNNEKL